MRSERVHPPLAEENQILLGEAQEQTLLQFVDLNVAEARQQLPDQ
jgi:hypothetical protein